jgi:hypothetical protein
VTAGSYNVRTRREFTGSGGTLPDGYPMESRDRDNGKYHGELSIGVVKTIDFHRDEV